MTASFQIYRIHSVNAVNSEDCYHTHPNSVQSESHYQNVSEKCSVVSIPSYLRGLRFESHPMHQLFWLRFIMAFLGLSQKITG